MQIFHKFHKIKQTCCEKKLANFMQIFQLVANTKCLSSYSILQENCWQYWSNMYNVIDHKSKIDQSILFSINLCTKRKKVLQTNWEKHDCFHQFFNFQTKMEKMCLYIFSVEQFLKTSNIWWNITFRKWQGKNGFMALLSIWIGLVGLIGIYDLS